jgi:hypothetical protein
MNTQITADSSPQIKRATEKLIRSIRSSVMSCNPSDALTIWQLVKSREIKRNDPTLSDAQVQTMIALLAKQDGADVISAALSVEDNTSVSSNGKQAQKTTVKAD